MRLRKFCKGFSIAFIIVICTYLVNTLEKLASIASDELLLPRKFLKSISIQSPERNDSNASDITCVLITSPPRHNLAMHMTVTWMEDCNHIVTMTSDMEPSLKNVQLTRHSSYHDLWGKVLSGFKNLNDSTTSWFLKADDDTFVVMKNLRKFLSRYNPDEPLLVGLQLLYPDNKSTSTPLHYVSGGAGYVLSREALRRFQNTNNHLCKYPGVTAYEDVNMGNCLHSLGVRQIDTRDSMGRSKFLPYSPWIMMKEKLQNDEKYIWVQKESKFQLKFGAEHLTDEPISFHEVRVVNDVYLLHYFFNVLVTF